MDDEKAELALVVGQDMTRDDRVDEIGKSDIRFRRQSSGDYGYTPSGGSRFQQSSRLIMAVLYLCTAALVAAVCSGFGQVRDLYGEELELLKQFAPKSPAEVAVILELYGNASAAAVDPEVLCDAAFFATASEDEAIVLIDTFTDMEYASRIFFATGATMAAIYLTTKFCTTFALSVTINREENKIPKLGDKAKSSSLKPLVVINGAPETVEQRRTRIFLRSETLGYMFLQMAQDIPLVTLALVYYLLRRSRRGTKCAECFADGVVCEVDGFADTPQSVQLAFAVVLLSLFWNASLIAERWFAFIAYKRTIKKGGYNAKKYLIVAAVSVGVYILVIMAPVLLLVYYRIGPNFFNADDGLLNFVKFVGFVGIGLWGVAILVINFLAGIDPGELLCCPLLCFEVCEIFCEPIAGSCECCCC